MFLSFDIGGSSIKYGVVNGNGRILKKNSIKTIDDKSRILNDLLSIIDKIKLVHKIEGVGISAPGIIRSDGYMITAGAIRSLYGENIKKVIEAETGLPVTIDNDANAAAIAEKWLGNAKEMKNYIFLVLGTGVGGGIVINNQVYSGANGMAGEIGWGIVKNLPDDGFIEVVSLNQRAAVVSGLCRIYNEQKRLTDPNCELTFNAEEIFANELEGEIIAKRVLEGFLTDLSIGLLNLISFFDPEAILIGGGISQNQEFAKRLELKLIELKHRHESLNQILPVINTPVIIASLKNDAGILGATYQIKQKVKSTS